MRPRLVALVFLAASAAALLVTSAVVGAVWLGPAAPRVRLPANGSPPPPPGPAAGADWFVRGGGTGRPTVLLLVGGLGVGVVLLLAAIHGRRRATRGARAVRLPVRRSGRWWPLVLVTILVTSVAVLAAHRYTTGVVAADTHTEDVGPGALAPGTGPVLQVTHDGVRSQMTPPGRVALTFDDGPDPRWTPQILDVLARHHVAATFFVTGEEVTAHPDLVRRMVADGSEVGVHTYRHLEITHQGAAALRRDLALTQLAIVAATGHRTALFRPPFISGMSDVDLLQYVALMQATGSGYVTVLSDRESTDWSKPGVDAIVNRAMPRYGAGAIIELHDGGGDRSQTVVAVERLVTRLQRAGYQFETVGQIARLPLRRLMPAAPIGERVWARTFVDAMSLAGVGSAGIAFLVAFAALFNLVRVGISVLLAHRARRRAPTAPVALAAMPSVSVLVAAYDEEANLPATLRALTALQAVVLEVVVVDDGSRDATASLVERWPDDRVRLLRTRHAGKAAALSAGLAGCRGEIVVTVDADTRPDRDALRHLVAPFRDPKVAAVSGNLRIADASGWLGRAQQLEYVIANAFDRRALDALGSQVTVPGAIGAYRRRTLLALGGFDGATIAEDTDLTLALVAAGHRVRFAPAAYARTEGPKTVRALWRQRSRWSFGILQAVWRRRPWNGDHRDRRAVLTWAYAFVTQVATPLMAPLLDVAAIWALVTGTTWPLVLWSAVLVLQFAAAVYALRCEGESLGALWAFPLHVLGYRQLTAFVVPQAVAWAVAGPIGVDVAQLPSGIDRTVEIPAAGAAAGA